VTDIEPFWLAILERFGITSVVSAKPGGGTAAPKILVTTTGGRYLVRQRRPLSSPEPIVVYDHAVIQAVADAGIPTARPCLSTACRTWVYADGMAYEAFPFLEGLQPFEPDNLDQLRSAAITLAQFHRATAGLQPPGRKDWPREHRALDMIGALERALAECPASPEQADQAQRMLECERRLASQLTDETVASLPHVITHGDFTPANVGFRGNAVGGVFDFDWVSRQARVLDIGEAAQFFACKRSAPLDPSDIWSLVAAWQPDTAALRAFLQAYQTVWPLSRAEAEALPLFMAETWLGVRVRAMRKVPPEQRLRILTEGALPPLLWLKENAEWLAHAAMSTAP